MKTEVLDLTGDSVLPEGQGSVVTVGTFDGVHRGHWAVLDEIRRRARATGRRSVLVTFHPHPLRIVRPEHAPQLLTTAEEKKEILAGSGLDYAVFVPFTPELSQYPPERFVDEILLARLGVEELVIGYDHGFGKGRSGDAATLTLIGRDRGFEVDVVPPVSVGANAVSSSGIRKAVAEARLADAEEGLGRPYSVRGIVVRGDQRGRELGFPTANLSGFGSEKLLPPMGIYSVRVVTRHGEYAGALHLGPRPTFQGAPPTVEVFLLDFDGDLYGEVLRVEFIRKLRDIIRYDDVNDLIAQMGRDVEEVRRGLTTTG